MKVTDLKQDGHNANKGTRRGRKLVGSSLQRYGAGRSVLIDRDGRLIAGNKTAAEAQAAGIQDVLVVQTDGTKLVAVQRTDLSLDDPKAKELAIADNRTSEIGLEWDKDALAEMVSAGDMQLEPFFTVDEMAAVLEQPAPPPSDPNAEYQGMPSYVSEDKTAHRDIIVHFRNDEDVREFAKLVGQTISDKTKYIWFPKDEGEDLASFKYVEK